MNTRECEKLEIFHEHKNKCKSAKVLNVLNVLNVNVNVDMSMWLVACDWRGHEHVAGVDVAEKLGN